MRFRPVLKSTLALAGALAIATPALADDYADGVAAFEKGRYVSALAPLTRAADAGNADAQYRLGLIYKDGLGVPTDKARASVLLQKALLQFQKAADAGDADALYTLGDMYRYGEGVAVDFDKAAEFQKKSAVLFRKAAYQGDAHAQYRLGTLYADDSEQSIFWLQKATDQGNTQALIALYPQSRDDTKSLALLQKAAEAGDANAQVCLGNFLLDRAAPGDGARAVALFEKAMDQGHNDIPYYRIGWAYQFGEALPKSGAKAALWYQRSIEREGNANVIAASAFLSDIYIKGEGVPRDPAKARYWQRKAEDSMHQPHP